MLAVLLLLVLWRTSLLMSAPLRGVSCARCGRANKAKAEAHDAAKAMPNSSRAGNTTR